MELFNHRVYAICGDGCLMEGIGSEAASLAGHLGLDHLCWIYDNNGITIEGSTRLAFSEDVHARFESYGWRVFTIHDCNDLGMIERVLQKVREPVGRPTLIMLDTHIGFGSPHRQDTAAAHGEPLGAAETRLTKRVYGWPEDASFLVPGEVRDSFNRGIGARGARLRASWLELRAAYRARYPGLSEELDRIEKRELPAGWDRDLPEFPADRQGVAGREVSGQVLNILARNIPWLLGGSADLGPSTKTVLKAVADGHFQAGSPGRNLHFGVREHAMAAIVNGLTLAKLRAFGSTFFVFSDYARPAIRLAALMELPAIFIFTHDGLGDGEDGPTHQPVEHLASLRAMPGISVLRPGDANEVVEAYRVIVQLRDRPAVLVLSRQALPTLDRSRCAAAGGVAKGAYVLIEAPGGAPQVIFIASGSELHLVVEAHERLLATGVRSRVVSMPSWDLFERQPQSYRDHVLPPAVRARIAVEQAATFGWERHVGQEGTIVGMTRFGASAPLRELQKRFGFNVDDVVDAALETVARHARGG
jgi:transketolase